MKTRSNFTYKVKLNNRVVSKCQTHSIRRFCNRIRLVKWQNGQSVYLRVYYGMGLDNWGKMTAFYNDGDYETKVELLKALSAFTEKGSLLMYKEQMGDDK